ncbi:hypothetical protein DXG03_008890 [Asterophora parasitica]|uniref:Uncharacterized protein n=1 Tax=Asterophora parasitica TaxID=117018 RepID=A0A9P7G029_9AGAR|nr:hypothetical protein DXG03_008890 [Asterophora parasitica]
METIPAFESAHVAAEENVRIREAERQAVRRREDRIREAARLAEQEAWVKTQHEVLGSTRITCAAGREIRDHGIVSGFESRLFTIYNLPANVRHDEIIQLFTQQGVNCDAIHILSISPVNEDRREAKVITSAEWESAIVSVLGGIEFRNNRLQVQAGENTSNTALDESSVQGIDTLTMTVFAPSSIMVAKLTPRHAISTERSLRNGESKR